MVHRRQVDDDTLVFGVHGALWGNAMTWWDHDTGSVWSQPIGEAIAGPRKGQILELRPVSFSTWGAWQAAHPQTVALAAPAGVAGFDNSDFVIVVEFGEQAIGYPIDLLRQEGVINDVVGGAAIAIVSDPNDPQRWSVLSRTLDDQTVELIRVGTDIVDLATGTTWDPVRGLGIAGPLESEVLNKLPALISFPGDFETFWPDGRLWVMSQ